ncbi:MAG: hypothetical protein QOD56_1974, partial [Gammaproteobacteria bacterium]|nr:hypothetical protein [Gammaproteobacteria bacterium]
MDLLTEPVTKPPRRALDIHTANEWLDAVVTGACEHTEFLTGVGELLRRTPDTGWEMLALLDQYYRRGKLNAETFGKLKGHLQDLVMGKTQGGEVSVPLPRVSKRGPGFGASATSPFVPASAPVQADDPPAAAAAPSPVTAAPPPSTAAPPPTATTPPPGTAA